MIFSADPCFAARFGVGGQMVHINYIEETIGSESYQAIYMQIEASKQTTGHLAAYLFESNKAKPSRQCTKCRYQSRFSSSPSAAGLTPLAPPLPPKY